jgi:hypothetical protein
LPSYTSISNAAVGYTVYRDSTVAKVLCYKWKVAGSIPDGVSGFFIDIKYFRSHYGPGVDSASNRNEYEEYFLGVKAAGA